MTSADIKTYLVSERISNDVHGKSCGIRFFLSSAAGLFCFDSMQDCVYGEGGGGGGSAGLGLDEEYEIESISGEEVFSILYARSR